MLSGHSTDSHRAVVVHSSTHRAEGSQLLSLQQLLQPAAQRGWRLVQLSCIEKDPSFFSVNKGNARVNCRLMQKHAGTLPLPTGREAMTTETSPNLQCFTRYLLRFVYRFKHAWNNTQRRARVHFGTSRCDPCSGYQQAGQFRTPSHDRMDTSSYLDTISSWDVFHLTAHIAKQTKKIKQSK